MMLSEEQELTRLEAEQAALEEQVTTAELTLETSKTETAQFQHRYHQTVGRLYAQLDELDALIAKVQAGLSPMMPPHKRMRMPPNSKRKHRQKKPG